MVRNAKGSNFALLTTPLDARSRQPIPCGCTTCYEYDALGRRTAVIFADGTGRTTTVYDPLGNRVAETDPAGKNDMRFEYDAVGQMTAVVDALGDTAPNTATTKSEIWFAASMPTAVKRDSSTTVCCTLSRRCCRWGRGLRQGTTQQETALPPLISMERPPPASTTRTIYWSPNGSRTGSSVVYTYTPSGKPATVEDTRGLTAFTDEMMDRLASRTEPDCAYISYGVPPARSNIVSLTTPAGSTHYTYDAANRMRTVTDRDGGTTSYSYDSVGRLVGTEYPNGVVAVRQYDALDRLIGIQFHTPTGGTLAGYEYTFNQAGLRTEVREDNGRRVEYAYDKLYRLVEERVSDPVAGDRSFRYSYDAVGNRLTKDDSLLGMTTYRYDENDRLVEEITGQQSYDVHVR